MNKTATIALLGIAIGGGFIALQEKNISPALQIRANPADILYYEDKYEYAEDAKGVPIEASKKMVRAYAYRSDEVAPAAKNEISRTKNSVVYKVNDTTYRAEFYAGDSFSKTDTNEWRVVKYATTTIDAFQKQTSFLGIIPRVYADDFPATSGGDGYITSGAGTFANVRGAGVSLGVNKINDDGNLYQDISWYLRRLFFPFDTSAIDDGATVTGATVTLTHPSVNKNTSGTLNAAFVVSGQADGTSLASGDWTPDSFTLISDEKTFASIVAGGANSAHTWTLSDLTQISLTGYTTLALLGESDYENDMSTNSATNYVDFWFNEAATAGYRPKLTVTYTTGGGSPAPVPPQSEFFF